MIYRFLTFGISWGAPPPMKIWPLIIYFEDLNNRPPPLNVVAPQGGGRGVDFCLIPKPLWKGAICKLHTNGDHHSTLLDEIWLLVPSTASFIQLLSKVHNDLKTKWNRSNHKLQTKEDHHPTHLDEIWSMVLFTASFMHFSNKVYSKFRQSLYQVKTKFTLSLNKVYIKFRQCLHQV